MYFVDPLAASSLPSLALRVWRSSYFNVNAPPIRALRSSTDLMVRLSFTGGLTEVFKGYGENVYHYDVNSM